MIGHNDLCSKSCISTLQSLGLSRKAKVEPRDYEKNIRKSEDKNVKACFILTLFPTGLDILVSQLPKTFVVLMAPVDVTMALDLVNKPKTCVLSHLYECPCLFGNEDQGGRKRVSWLWRTYRSFSKSLLKIFTSMHF